MNRAEHIAEAERLLHSAEDDSSLSYVANIVARAQVHATLACSAPEPSAVDRFISNQAVHPRMDTPG